MSTGTSSSLEAPFLGLRYFDESNVHLFFGREEQVNDILEKLRRSRFVTVIGSSGSGKSSLVRAGVVPALRRGFLAEAGTRWRVIKMRPGSNPVASLARGLGAELSASSLEVALRRGPLGIIDAVREAGLGPNDNLLIVADQFEEVFRYQRESSDRDRAREEAAAFVKLLLEAANQREFAIYIMLTMRSDYLGNCAQFRDLPERINDGLYLVPRMRRDQLEQTIAGPIAVEDAEIASRLVQRLLNEVGDDPDQLPVLQHALLRAWNNWNGAPRPIDFEDLDAIGGLTGSLSRHADEIYNSLSLAQKRIARILFQRLTERDAEGREIRRPVPIEDIAAVAGERVMDIQEVAARFSAPDVSLLTWNEDGYLDITHESLIRKWGRIQGEQGPGWIQDEVDARDEFLELRKRAGKKDALAGAALAEGIAWRSRRLNDAWAKRYTRNDGAFDDAIRFINECEASEVAHRKAVRRNRWLLFGSLVAAVLVFAGLWRNAVRSADAANAAQAQARAEQDAAEKSATQAELQKKDADAQRNTARDLAKNVLARQLLPQAQQVVDARSPELRELGVLLAIESARRMPTSDVSEVLWRLVPSIPRVVVQHSKAVNTVAVSPDGHVLATGSAERTVKLWDLRLRTQLASIADRGEVRSIAFSPDGKRLITAGGERVARLWDIHSSPPRLIAQLHHDDIVNAVAYSKTGRVATAGSDKAVVVWDVSTLPAKQSWRMVLREPIYALTFSPDGTHLAVGSRDDKGHGTLGVADTAAPPPPYFSMGGGYPGLKSIAFALDGTLFVAGSERKVERMRFDEVYTHDDALSGVAVSSNGCMVATAGRDGVLKLWARRRYAATELARWTTDSSITSLSLSETAGLVVTGSEDGSARAWELPNTTLACSELGEPAFSPDSKTLAVVSRGSTLELLTLSNQKDRSVKVPDLRAIAFEPGGQHLALATRSGGSVWAWADVTQTPTSLNYGREATQVAVSRDGLIATLVDPSIIRVHQINPPAELKSYERLGNGPVKITGFAFPSGSPLLAIAADDGKVRFWNPRTGEERPEPPALPHPESVLSIAFSPDGKRVATGSADHKAHLWDWKSGKKLLETHDHDAAVVGVAFIGDARRLATLDTAGLHLWNTGGARPIEVGRLPLGARMTNMAVSPDSRQIAIAGRTLTTIFTNSPDQIALACSKLSRNLTPDEWAQYIADGPRKPTCANLP